MTRIDKVGLSVWETLALVRGEQALQQAREAGLVTDELAALLEAADRAHAESWALLAGEVR